MNNLEQKTDSENLSEPIANHSKPLAYREKRFFTTKNMTVIAMLTALSYLLYMFVKFPLPFFPPFLDIQFSDMPALIGGFMLGPTSGCLIIVLKCLLKMPFSSTFCVGELADIFVGIAFVLPSAWLYRKIRTKKGAVAALSLGAVCATVIALATNAFVMGPLFGKLYGWDNLISALRGIFPSITRDSFYLYYLPFSILPFNILRCFICALITFLVYKGTEKLIYRMFRGKNGKIPLKNKHKK